MSGDGVIGGILVALFLLGFFIMASNRTRIIAGLVLIAGIALAFSSSGPTAASTSPPLVHDSGIRHIADDDDPDVKVHHSDGCGLCGRTDAHAHPWSQWDRFIESGR